ncbi:MAG: hypothetical protein QMB40_11780 [Aeromonadaceae bacterium]
MQTRAKLSLALCLLASVLTMSGCGDSDSTTTTPKSDVPVTLNEDVRTRGVAPDETTTVFIFDVSQQQDQLDLNKVTQIDSVDVRGSFNGWGKTAGFDMTQSQTDEGIWYLSLPSS